MASLPSFMHRLVYPAVWLVCLALCIALSVQFAWLYPQPCCPAVWHLSGFMPVQLYSWFAWLYPRPCLSSCMAFVWLYACPAVWPVCLALSTALLSSCMAGLPGFMSVQLYGRFAWLYACPAVWLVCLVFRVLLSHTQPYKGHTRYLVHMVA